MSFFIFYFFLKFEKYGIPTKYIKYILLKMYEHRSTQDLYRKISESKDINTWRYTIDTTNVCCSLFFWLFTIMNILDSFRFVSLFFFLFVVLIPFLSPFFREVAISDPCLSGEGVFHARVPDPLLFGTPSAVSTNLCSSNGKRSLDASDYDMDTVQSASESSTSEYGSVTYDEVGSFDMKRAKRE